MHILTSPYYREDKIINSDGSLPRERKKGEKRDIKRFGDPSRFSLGPKVEQRSLQVYEEQSKVGETN